MLLASLASSQSLARQSVEENEDTGLLEASHVCAPHEGHVGVAPPPLPFAHATSVSVAHTSVQTEDVYRSVMTCKYCDVGGAAADGFDRICEGTRSGTVTQICLWESGAVIVADQIGVALRVPKTFDRGSFLRKIALRGVKFASHYQKPYAGPLPILDDR